MKYIIVLVTAPSREEAERIADIIIDSKLAACVNISSDIKSIYLWKGKKETSCESLLIIKTKKALFEKLKNAIKRVHSYDTPEIIALPIVEGDKEYLDWIDNSVSAR